MSDGQGKKDFLERPVLFGNRTSKNLGAPVLGLIGHFKIFLPLLQNCMFTDINK